MLALPVVQLDFGLRSDLIKQTYLNWELYVIDDNSKDKSFELAKSFKKNKKINVLKLMELKDFKIKIK